MKFDYHTHRVVPQGGYLNAVTTDDWAAIATAPARMIACYGVHPWHASSIESLSDYAFMLDEWLTQHPSAGVGESGLDLTPKHVENKDAQLSLLHIHLGAAFRHERRIHLHGAGAWSELLTILRERKLFGTLPLCQLHAWNGSLEMAREFLALGAEFSVGMRELSHPKAQQRYARIPADRIHPESDDSDQSWDSICALFDSVMKG